jgi:ankyrin repeat protein
MKLRIHRIAICLLAATLAVLGQQPKSDSRLLQQIREGNAGEVQKLLRSGDSPNARDATGATALMMAAAFGPPEILRLLIDAGADINATNPNGAAALMWATHDRVKVRLLLDRGADVNARRSDGAPVWISAALRGNVEVLRMLVAAGADVRTGAISAPWRMELPHIAYTTNDPALREFMNAAGLTLQDVTGWTPPPLTSVLLTNIFAWRPQPYGTKTPDLKALLGAGANPNEVVAQLTLSVPALSRLIGLEDLESLRLLLDRGADPNRSGSRGLTPVMFAAASGSPQTVQLLLARGASVNARDERGRTALDWALLQGETETAGILRKAGAVPMAPAEAKPKVVSTPRTAGAAMEVALRRLQPASPGFHEKTGCISCHNQSLPAIAVKLAGMRDVKVDRQLAKHPTEATLKVWAASRENLLFGHCSIFGFMGNVSYGLLGLAEEEVLPNAVTDAVTSCLSGLQGPDGSWTGGGDLRPPLLTPSPFVYTALAVRGLNTYSPPGRRTEIAARVARARDFLRNAAPADTQDEAFKLLGLVWSGAPQSEISRQTRRLLLLQRENGGWAQMPTMEPDAYATGQALYALHASGLSASNASYQAAAQYLLRTQLEDGTWYVRSRAIGFQPYVETGFPHGPDQFISAAATAWAVIGLAYTL